MKNLFTVVESYLPCTSFTYLIFFCFSIVCWLPSSGYSQMEDTLWFEDFEGNWSSDWHTDFGTWEVGTPTSGSGSAYSPPYCAATILNGNYGNYTNSRLIRHTPFVVPPASQNPRLRFRHWYSFAINDDDWGKVQVRVVGTPTWEDLPNGYYRNWSGGIYTNPYIDLSNYAGLLVEIAFYFHSDDYYTAPGWYIDDVAVITSDILSMNIPEEWEDGFGNWYVDHGVWELGTPTSGPGSAHQGQNCVSTILSGNYGNYLASRLISPPFVVPPASENPRLRFWHWYRFAINDNDWGKVQIKVAGHENWEDLPNGYFHN